MLIFVVFITIKGQVFNFDTMFTSKAKCEAYANYKKVEMKDGVENFKCVAFKEVKEIKNDK